MSENNDFGMKLKSYRKARETGPIKTMSPGTATRGTWKSSIRSL